MNSSAKLGWAWPAAGMTAGSSGRGGAADVDRISRRWVDRARARYYRWGLGGGWCGRAVPFVGPRVKQPTMRERQRRAQQACYGLGRSVPLRVRTAIPGSPGQMHRLHIKSTRMRHYHAKASQHGILRSSTPVRLIADPTIPVLASRMLSPKLSKHIVFYAMVVASCIMLHSSKVLGAETQQETNALEVCRQNKGAWSENEKRAWTELCMLGRTDFRDEVVSSSFVYEIFTDKILNSALEGKRVVISNASFPDPVRLAGLNVKSSLWFIGCHFLSDLDLSGSNLELDLSILGSSVAGEFRARSAHIGGSVAVGSREGDEPQQEQSLSPVTINSIDLDRVRVDGSVSIVEIKSNNLRIAYANIGQTLNIVNAIARNVDLHSSNIGNQLVMIGSEFWPRSASLVPEYDKTAINANFMRSAASVFFNRSVFYGDTMLDGAEINGDFHLEGAHLDSLYLLAADIKGRLTVGVNNVRYAPVQTTEWEPGAVLDLGASKIGSVPIFSSLCYWPNKINFADLSVETLSEAADLERSSQQGQIQVAPGEQDNSACAKVEASPKWFVEWLARQSDGRYYPSSYTNISSHLRSYGDIKAADEVDIDSKRLAMWNELRSGLIFKGVISFLLFITIGSGYELWLAALWAVELTIVGALVFRRTPEAKAASMPCCLAFSFDMLIPLIRLREMHYKIDIAGRARYYFYFHRIAGWILGSFIVAALTGITK